MSETQAVATRRLRRGGGLGTRPVPGTRDGLERTRPALPPAAA